MVAFFVFSLAGKTFKKAPVILVSHKPVWIHWTCLCIPPKCLKQSQLHHHKKNNRIYSGQRHGSPQKPKKTWKPFGWLEQRMLDPAGQVDLLLTLPLSRGLWKPKRSIGPPSNGWNHQHRPWELLQLRPLLWQGQVQKNFSSFAFKTNKLKLNFRNKTVANQCRPGSPYHYWNLYPVSGSTLCP